MNRTILLIPTVILAVAVTASAASAQVVADSACPKYTVDIASFATCEGARVAKDVTEEPRREKFHAAQAGRDLSKESPVLDAANVGSNMVPTNRSRTTRTISNFDRPAK